MIGVHIGRDVYDKAEFTSPPVTDYIYWKNHKKKTTQVPSMKKLLSRLLPLRNQKKSNLYQLAIKQFSVKRIKENYLG